MQLPSLFAITLLTFIASSTAAPSSAIDPPKSRIDSKSPNSDLTRRWKYNPHGAFVAWNRWRTYWPGMMGPQADDVVVDDGGNDEGDFVTVTSVATAAPTATAGAGVDVGVGVDGNGKGKS